MMWSASTLELVCALLLLGPKLHGAEERSDGDVESESEESSVALNGKPVISAALSPDLVAVLDRDVRLQCHVANLGNRTVSWFRERDLHLLTVGRYTYTADQRFSAYHIPMTHLWQLRIRGVTHKDAGRYECQVSTTPPITHSVSLTVVEPFTDILGGPDLHVDRGSTINLTCVAKFSPAPPPDVEWFHNGELISFDSSRGGVSLLTEKGESTMSQLLIQRATAKDSGQYKCVPANAVEASINLHILQGKGPDAWQTSSSPPRAWTHARRTALLTAAVAVAIGAVAGRC